MTVRIYQEWNEHPLLSSINKENILQGPRIRAKNKIGLALMCWWALICWNEPTTNTSDQNWWKQIITADIKWRLDCQSGIISNFIHPSVVTLYSYYVQLQGIFTSSINLFKEDPLSLLLLLKNVLLMALSISFYEHARSIYEEKIWSDHGSGEWVWGERPHTIGITLGRWRARKYNKKPLVACHLNQNQCYFFLLKT